MLCQKRIRYKTEHPSSEEEKGLLFVSLAAPEEGHFSPRCVVRARAGDPAFPTRKGGQRLSLDAGGMVIFVVFVRFNFKKFSNIPL